MGRFVLVCFVLVQIFLVQAMAARSGGLELNPLRVVVRTGDVGTIAEQPSTESSSSSSGEAAAPEMISRKEKHGHSGDKSVAGGGVIIGGLVTAIFAAVYCYIRVTRRRDGDKQ